MNKLLSSLLIATALSTPLAFAEGSLLTTTVDGKRRVEFAVNGNTNCVMVDDKIFCIPGAAREPVKLASAGSN
jgi:hypothetical protein